MLKFVYIVDKSTHTMARNSVNDGYFGMNLSGFFSWHWPDSCC